MLLIKILIVGAVGYAVWLYAMAILAGRLSPRTWGGGLGLVLFIVLVLLLLGRL